MKRTFSFPSAYLNYDWQGDIKLVSQEQREFCSVFIFSELADIEQI